MARGVPILRARTLVEAYLYINLTVAAATEPTDQPEDENEAVAGVGPALDYDRWTTLTEGPEAWTLLFDGPDTGERHRFALFVPYETEYASRRENLRFGPGRSEIIDPGQWQLLGAGYARRALRDDLFFAETPTDPERFHDVVVGWEFARDAVVEAAKFLAEGADEVPEEAFWTEVGAATRRDEPERFTRDGLESDIALYQRNLDDFIALYGEGVHQ
ncbi:MAG: hypothetical protein JWQ95_4207 [Sphaerisporangium sp.]|jgi:hypothetical protein|nr:hypothetical protein [Sphaerisporangium sp.]